MIKVPFLLVPVLLGLSAAANAEAPPDAGALLQQIEKNRQPALPKKSTQDVRIAPPPLEALSGPSVTVKHFQVDGNALLDDATLQRALAPFLDRPLSFQELQRAALAVSDAYRQAGWIARAYLPRQEIDGGTVTIQVVNLVAGRYSVEWNQVMAATLLATLPVAVVFTLLQRYLVTGLIGKSGETLTVAIKASGPDGPMFHAALSGRRRDLTDGALLRAALSVPAIGVKTMAAIHWEAVKLFVKGVPFLGRRSAAPAPAP